MIRFRYRNVTDKNSSGTSKNLRLVMGRRRRSALTTTSDYCLFSHWATSHHSNNSASKWSEKRFQIYEGVLDQWMRHPHLTPRATTSDYRIQSEAGPVSNGIATEVDEGLLPRVSRQQDQGRYLPSSTDSFELEGYQYIELQALPLGRGFLLSVSLFPHLALSLAHNAILDTVLLRVIWPIAS